MTKQSLYEIWFINDAMQNGYCEHPCLWLFSESAKKRFTSGESHILSNNEKQEALGNLYNMSRQMCINQYMSDPSKGLNKSFVAAMEFFHANDEWPVLTVETAPWAFPYDLQIRKAA